MGLLDILLSKRIPDRVMDKIDGEGKYEGWLSRYEVHLDGASNTKAIKKINKITRFCSYYSINGIRIF